MELSKKLISLGNRSALSYVELDDTAAEAPVPMGIAICGALPSPATPVPAMAIAVCSGTEARGSAGPIAQLAMEPDVGYRDAPAVTSVTSRSALGLSCPRGHQAATLGQALEPPVGSVAGGVLAPDLVPAGLIWDKELVRGLCHRDDDVRYQATRRAQGGMRPTGERATGTRQHWRSARRSRRRSRRAHSTHTRGQLSSA
jgi:hypothetical protein